MHLIRLVGLSLLLAACNLPFENEPDADALSADAPSDLTLVGSYGIWVYGPGEWIHDKARVDAFISLALRRGINEVYLSTNFALLENPALPEFLRRMSNNGFKAEALIGKVSWGQASGRADMLSQLERINTYNVSRTYVERFKAIHLDVEPWIGTGTSTAWFTPLIQSYQAAHAYLKAKGLKLSVDFSGSKGANLTLAQRQSLTSSTDKTVLMLYEATHAEILSRATRFMNGLKTDRTVVMAVRAEDFVEPFSTIESVHTALAPATNYRGWAVYHYDSVQP